MARFSFDPVPEIAPTGAPGNDYEHIATSPEMFGGAIATGEQKLGQGAVSAADSTMTAVQAKQQLTNEISASETNTWLAKNLTDKFNAFGQLQGKAAQDALPQFKQDVEDLHQSAVKNAGSNLQMRAMLEQNSRYLTDAYYRYATNYADTQWRTWQAKTSTDRANEFGNQAGVAAQHGTWPEVDTFLNTSDDEIRKRDEATGLDADSIAANVAKQRGANVKNIVETLAPSDPKTAQAILDRYKGQMDAGSVLAVTDKLKTVNAELQGHQIADEETGRAPRAGAQPVTPGAQIPDEARPLLQRIGNTESGNRYNVIYNGKTFDNFADHPRQGQVITSGPDAGKISTAGGYYQFIAPTWDAEAKKLGLNDFSPANQDRAAWDLAQTEYKTKTGGDLLTDLKAGKPVDAVLPALSGQWSSLPGGRQPAGGTDKAAVYDRIIARTADNPLLQANAVARMNQIFSVERAQNTQNEVLFNQRIQDSTTEAFNTGKVTNPLTQQDFVTAHGYDQGSAQYDTYQKNLALGTDVAAAASMSPADRANLLTHYAPVAGQAGYADQLKRQETLAQQLQAQQKQQSDDPGGYAITRLPDVTAAYQGMAQVQQDPKATDAQRKAARANFAAVTQREQTRIGIPPAAQQILSKSEADQLNGVFATAAGAEDPNARTALVGLVQREANLWGDNWPSVMRQIAPSTQPIVRAIAAGADPVAMTRLLSIDPTKSKPADVLKEQSGTTMTKLNGAIETAMAPFRSSLVGRQVDRDYPSYFGLAQQLGSLYVRDGMGADEAAQKAFGDLIGNRYDFRDSWRLPKSAGFSGDDVQAGTLVARNLIASQGGGEAPADLPAAVKPGDFPRIKPAIDDMALGEANANDSISKFARDGRFVTSPDNSGLNLVAGDGNFVRSTGDQPLLLTWQQLATLGGTATGRMMRGDAVRQTSPAAYGAF